VTTGLGCNCESGYCLQWYSSQELRESISNHEYILVALNSLGQRSQYVDCNENQGVVRMGTRLFLSTAFLE
jgi:hypothetical protein